MRDVYELASFVPERKVLNFKMPSVYKGREPIHHCSLRQQNLHLFPTETLFQTSKYVKVYQIITHVVQEVLFTRGNLKEHWFSINLDMGIFIYKLFFFDGQFIRL